MLLIIYTNSYYTTICINCNLDFGAIGNPSSTNLVKPDGYVVLFSNRRKFSNNEIMSNYAELISKYAQEEFSKPLNTDKSYFFDLKPIHQIVFPNPQVFDLERLKGDLVSYSYIPNEGEPKFSSMISEFENLFEQNNNNGLLNFDYETVVYYCKMK